MIPDIRFLIPGYRPIRDSGINQCFLPAIAITVSIAVAVSIPSGRIAEGYVLKTAVVYQVHSRIHKHFFHNEIVDIHIVASVTVHHDIDGNHTCTGKELRGLTAMIAVLQICPFALRHAGQIISLNPAHACTVFPVPDINGRTAAECTVHLYPSRIFRAPLCTGKRYQQFQRDIGIGGRMTNPQALSARFGHIVYHSVILTGIQFPFVGTAIPFFKGTIVQ